MRPNLMPMPDFASRPAPCDRSSASVQNTRDAAQIRHAVRPIRARPYQAQYRALAELTHDLRSPLSGMIGLIDLLDNRAMTEADRERLALIRAASEQMIGLVDAVVDCERRSGNADEQFHPSQLLNQCITLAQAAAGNRALHFVRNFSPDLYQSIVGDSDALRVIVNNFLSNATKFCASGPITVTAKLRAGPDGHALTVAVRDVGPGIPRHQWRKIFERGKRLGSGVPGSGLGLALCEHRASRAGGRLAVRSVPGKGTIFFCALPVRVARGVPGPDLIKADGRVSERSFSRAILAVTGSQSCQTALQAKLEAAPFQLVHAACPSQALDHICTAYAQGRRFGAVIVDEHLDPALSGPLIEAIAIMSDAGAPIPVFTLASDDDAKQADNRRCHGFEHRLNPDFRPDFLSDLIAATQAHGPARSTRANQCSA